jgi:hypothetical protein
MLRREFVVRAVRYGFLSGSVASLSGCGTLFHGERRGQPHSNQIDWGVAALDGLGLLLFFVPGVVAFAVDFSTGAIYLPLAQCASYRGRPVAQPAQSGSMPSAESELVVVSDAVEFSRIDASREKLDRHSIERELTARVGRPVVLRDSEARVSQLTGLDQFASHWSLHRANRGFGTSLKNLLARRTESA